MINFLSLTLREDCIIKDITKQVTISLVLYKTYNDFAAHATTTLAQNVTFEYQFFILILTISLLGKPLNSFISF